MSNVNGPQGFRPLRTLDGDSPIVTAYTIAVDYATPLYQGDPVQMSGTGRNILLAEAGNADNLGVFWGCSYIAADGTPKWSKYWTGETGATTIVAHVYDNPYTIFEIQGDSTGILEADIGQLVDWTAGSGSTATGQSGAYVNHTFGTTGKALRLLGLSRKLNNDYGAYAKVEVMFVEHVLRSVVSSVGGV